MDRFLSWFFALATFLICLVACAPRATLNKSATISSVDNKYEIVHLNVPFFSNISDQCGPASLASVLNFWGKKATPDELKKEVYVPSIGGTLPMDLRPAVERRGLIGSVVSGSFEEMKVELRAQRPVIAYLNFGTRARPYGHFLVVVGFDEMRKGLYVHSGPAENKFASYKRFNRGWKDTDHWMLIVTPEDPLVKQPNHAARPVPHFETRMSAEEYFKLGQTYQQQKLGKEAVAQYQLALGEDKHFEPALMAVGNIAFEEQDYKTAEKYYRRVLRRDPAHGGANNNLAMVYLSSGKDLKTAEELATKALATDYRPYAEDTLDQIKKMRAGS